MNNKVKEFAKTCGPYTRWCETLEMYRGKLTTRIWAVKNNSKFGIQIQEAFRYQADKCWSSGNLYYTAMGGYHMMWKDRQCYGYYIYENDKHMYPQKRMWMPNMQKAKLYTPEDMQKLSGIKYFYINPDTFGYCNTIKYIENYKKYPNLEILSKMGWGWYYDTKTILKLEGEKKKKYIKVLMENKNRYLTLKNLQQMIKYNVKYEDLEKLNTKIRCDNFLKKRGYELDMKEFIPYREKNHYFAIDTYCDMLDMAKKLGYELDKSVLYPRDWRVKHDTYARLLNAKEKKENSKKLKKIASKYQDVNYKDLVLKILKSTKEFTETGKKLHNCVGSMNYDMDMVEGRCLIGVIYEKDKPLECLELNLEEGMKIEQLRGDHNQDSPRHSECKKCVNKFIKQYA